VKAERAWTGAVCGFFLFVVVCLSLLLHMKGTFRAGGNPELGLLLFLLPGAARIAPVCLAVMRIFFVTQRTFWQELAWLFSAVFWCALGALCFMFICAWLDTRRSNSSEH
jgi:lysylphosphatidylglycerol synthetase-like protein (DUF2156 family)